MTKDVDPRLVMNIPFYNPFFIEDRNCPGGYGTDFGILS